MTDLLRGTPTSLPSDATGPGSRPDGAHGWRVEDPA
jgi:hypothetical protein